MLTLKILGHDRVDEIMAFDKLCFPTDCWKEEDWHSLLQEDRAVYYALLDKDKLVAHVFIYNWKGEYDYVKIMNVAVHPDYRKQGVAARLLNRVTEDMKNDGMYLFRGETRSTNTAMQKAFESCGYKLDRVEEGYFHDPEEPAWKYLLSV